MFDPGSPSFRPQILVAVGVSLGALDLLLLAAGLAWSSLRPMSGAAMGGLTRAGCLTTVGLLRLWRVRRSAA